MEKLYNIRKNKGITLIALVITIIVLLILAGVSIAMLTGDNGLVTKASQSGVETRAAAIEEAVLLWKTNNKMSKYTPNGTTESLGSLLESLGPNGQKLLTSDEIDEINNNKQITIGTRTISFDDRDDIDVLRDYFIGKEWYSDTLFYMNDGMTYLTTYDISGVTNVDYRHDGNTEYIYISYKNNIYKLTINYHMADFVTVFGDYYICDNVENVSKPTNVGITNNQLVTAAGLVYDQDHYLTYGQPDLASNFEYEYHAWIGDGWDYFYDSAGVLINFSPFDP